MGFSSSSWFLYSARRLLLRRCNLNVSIEIARRSAYWQISRSGAIPMLWVHGASLLHPPMPFHGARDSSNMPLLAWCQMPSHKVNGARDSSNIPLWHLWWTTFAGAHRKRRQPLSTARLQDRLPARKVHSYTTASVTIGFPAHKFLCRTSLSRRPSTARA